MKKKKYTCPYCGGGGEYVMDRVDGWPIYEHCGFCDGTGELDGHMLGVALGCLSGEARMRKKQRARDLEDAKEIAKHMSVLEESEKEMNKSFDEV